MEKVSKVGDGMNEGLRSAEIEEEEEMHSSGQGLCKIAQTMQWKIDESLEDQNKST